MSFGKFYKFTPTITSVLIDAFFLIFCFFFVYCLEPLKRVFHCCHSPPTQKEDSLNAKLMKHTGEIVGKRIDMWNTECSLARSSVPHHFIHRGALRNKRPDRNKSCSCVRYCKNGRRFCFYFFVRNYWGTGEKCAPIVQERRRFEVRVSCCVN